MTPERTGHKILIFASDPILAALVGTMVECARYSAAFPTPEEAPAQAIERVRPLAAVLLDAGDHDVASDLFVSRAERLSVRVLLFGRREAIEQRRALARQRGLQAFVLPDEISRLEIAIEALIPDGMRPRSDRDRRAETLRTPAGTVDFVDARGVHWMVYDRRGPDRRNCVDRRFVSDDGEVRHCEITEQEARLVSQATLAEQLSRSVAE